MVAISIREITLISHQVADGVESVERVENVQDSAQPPLVGSQDQNPKDDPDKITQAPLDFTNPPYLDEQDLPQSSSEPVTRRQSPGHECNNTAEMVRTSKSEPTGQTTGTDVARARVHADKSRDPSPARSRSLSPGERERAHIHWLHRNIMLDIQQAQVKAMTGKVTHMRLHRPEDARPLDPADVRLSTLEERECIKEAFIRAHLYNRLHNGWDGKFLGRECLGRKRHWQKYGKNDRWMRHDWACGPYPTPQMPLPGAAN